MDAHLSTLAAVLTASSLNTFLSQQAQTHKKRTRRSILIYKVFLTTEDIKNDRKNYENKKCRS